MIQVKIVLELPTDIIETIRLEEQWENEGGTASNNIMDEWISKNKLPLSPGDCFKVVSGEIEQTENQVYYIVNLEPFKAEIHE